MRKAHNVGNWSKLLCSALVMFLFLGCSTQQIKPVNHNHDLSAMNDTENFSSQNTSEQKDESSQSKLDLFLDSAGQDLQTLPGIVIDETGEVFTNQEHWLPLMLAGAASIAMHNTDADDDIADNFEDNQILCQDFDEVVATIGGPGFHFGAAGLWYAISAGERNEFQKQRAWTMLKALSVNGAITLGLKLVRDNRTPNDKPLAWPSGHTSSSFTVAAVLDEFYGPEVGIPAYLGAGFVGYRMMESGDHWASDVVFGAVLGYIVGHQVASKHEDPEFAGFKIAPYINPADEGITVGLTLTKKF